MDYLALSDNEILARISAHDDDAMDYMVRKYGTLVKKESRAWFLIGGDADDVYQEGMIGLFKAIRDYEEDKGASFSTFATLCIRSQIKTAINKSNRKKHSPLNEYISIYAGEEEGDALADDLEADAGRSNPEQMMIEREHLESLYEKMKKPVSKMEAQVLELYLDGQSYGAIAERLEISEKSVDNALQRIRMKLKQGDYEKQ